MPSPYTTEKVETVIIRDKNMEAGYRIINADEVSTKDLILDEIPAKKTVSKKLDESQGE